MAIAELDCLRDEFVETLKADVKSLIRLHDKDVEARGRPGEWLRSVRRAAVVLIAANLEHFVEEAVCLGLLHLADAGVVAHRYPEEFRLWRFKQDAHQRNRGLQDSRQLIDLSLKLSSSVRALEEEELALDALRDGFDNPTAANVNRLMGLLGKEDYVEGVSVTVNGVATPARPALEEIANRRNAVAHGDSVQDPSIDDVKRLQKFAQVLSTRIKRDVTHVIEGCMPKVP